MELGLQNRAALVAASTKGLGFALAQELVREGCRVMICGRDAARLEAAVVRLRAQLPANGEAAAVTGLAVDVMDPAGVQQLVEHAVAAFGGLDIVVTNAGGPAGGTFDTTAQADWERGVQLTLMSAVRLIRAALPYLRQSDAASILAITSISVKQPIAGLLLSNVIRPAVAGLVKALSQELGPEGIRANAILPGWTETERVGEILAYRAQVNGSSPAVERDKITVSIPLGRMARPEEFGRVAAFMVSPAASYLNGVMLPVDGGSYQGLL